MSLTYFSNVLSEWFGPDWTRTILLAGTFLSEAAVAIGILLESKFKTRRDWTAAILVIGGVCAGVFFTLVLFANDEEISSAQQSTISDQQLKIIALNKEIAPRRLSDDQQKQLGQWLSPFSGKTVRVSSYALDFEAAFLGQQIIQSLRLAGINPISALLCEAPVGSIVLAIHVTGADPALVSALLKHLPTVDLISSPDPVPPSIISCSTQGTGLLLGGPASGIPQASGADATIFVGTKLPAE
jgi:hypothetical protein